MSQPVFSPGFRFSLRDAVVLAFSAVLSAVVQMSDLWIGIAIAFVVLHFFLFCNVLRITRPPELVWAAVFSGLVICSTLWGIPSWPTVFAASLLVTVIIVFIEVRRASYHGACWRKINPGLPQWWQNNIAVKFQNSSKNM